MIKLQQIDVLCRCLFSFCLICLLSYIISAFKTEIFLCFIIILYFFSHVMTRNLYFCFFQTIQNFECFHHFLSKCITLETSFNCIRNWLLSESLGNKLVSIAAVVCNESIKPGNEINTECGWDIISLVLTAEHNSGTLYIICI